MKNKALTALLGVCAAMTVLSGCGSKQNSEQAVVEIAGVEVVTEAGAERVQSETMELDLSQELESGDVTAENGTDDFSELEEFEELTEAETAETELQLENSTETPNTRKPGEAEEETELTEKETEKVQKESSKDEGKPKKKETEKSNKNDNTVEKDTQQNVNLPKETELTSVELDEVQKITEVVSETEAADQMDKAIMTVCDRVNIRKEPSTESAIAALFVPGMKFLVLNNDGEWALVRFETGEGLTEGYVKSEFLFDAEKIYLVKETINIRKEPSTDSEKLGKLLSGDRVLLLEEAEDGWIKICYSTDTAVSEAYVKAEFLENMDMESGISRLLYETQDTDASVMDTEESTTEEAAESAAEAEEASESETETEESSEFESETDLEEVSESEQETDAESEELKEEALVKYDLDKIMTVNDRVNVRAEAGTDASALDLLIPGNIYELLQKEGDWVRIGYYAEDTYIEGYIKEEFVLDGSSVYEASEKVNVRKDASTDAEKVAQLLEHDLVVVIEEEEEDASDDWSNIRFSAGGKIVDAFVKSEFLKEVDLEEMLAEMEQELADDTEEPDDSSTASDDVNSEDKKSEDHAVAKEEPASETVSLSSGSAGQYELIRMLFPDAASVGMIYSEANKDAADNKEVYEKLANEHGFELCMISIVDALDIDLAASDLVGKVDAVICLDDPVVNELVQTICAYADEVAIPVFGISEEQAEVGCLAVYDGKTVLWNEAEADAFSLDINSLNLNNLKVLEK